MRVSSWKMVPPTPLCAPPACEKTALSRRFTVDPSETNLLAAICDTTGATIIRKTSKDTTWDCFAQGGNPPSNNTYTGGWTVSAAGGGFCAVEERLPNLVDGFYAKLTAGPATAALRLAAGNHGPNTHGPSTISITSGLFQVAAGRSYVLTGFVRASRPSLSTNLDITASFFQWAPARAVDAGTVVPVPSMNATATTMSIPSE